MKGRGPVLVVEGLDVFYGRAHTLQGVSLTIDKGVLGIVGRNGMGKTTLCNAITAWCRPAAASSFSARRSLAGAERDHQAGASPTCRRAGGCGLAFGGRDAEAGGQPAARGRAHLRNVPAPGRAARPRRRAVVRRRAADARDRPRAAAEPAAAVMWTSRPRAWRGHRRTGGAGAARTGGRGRDRRAADRAEPRRGDLGRRPDRRDGERARAAADACSAGWRRTASCRSGCWACARAAPTTRRSRRPAAADAAMPQQVMSVRRAHGEGAPSLDDPAPGSVRGFKPLECRRGNGGAAGRYAARQPACGPDAPGGSAAGLRFPGRGQRRPRGLRRRHLRHQGPRAVLLRQCLERLGLRVVTVDLSTSGKPSPASVHPREVARHHRQGEAAVFSNDRGDSMTAMAAAFEAFIKTRRGPRAG